MARSPSRRAPKKPKTPRDRRRTQATPQAVAAPTPTDADDGLPPNARAASRFPIAGIGASAGGLEAIRDILSVLPPDTGIAILIVQHLARDRQSLLPEILALDSRLPVVEARSGAVVQPNRVYVMPPNTEMKRADGHLRLEPRGPAGTRCASARTRTSRTGSTARCSRWST